MKEICKINQYLNKPTTEFKFTAFGLVNNQHQPLCHLLRYSLLVLDPITITNEGQLQQAELEKEVKNGYISLWGIVLLLTSKLIHH